MDFTTYKNKFTEKAAKMKMSDLDILDCLNYAEPLIKNKIPVIYNTTHFSKLVGVRKAYIKRVSIYTKSYYRSFEIAKRSGKSRMISEPLPNLKLIHSFILEEILNNVPISSFAKAYKRKSSIKENIRFHVNQKYVLTIDIENFFNSISKEMVEKVFLELGYSELLSDLFSKLCTLNDVLPQGAPTSPYISNIVLKSFDKKIADYCLTKGIKYTRYADDITLSGDFDTKEAFTFVEQNINEIGLSINKTKTRVMTKDMSQVVTGIVVNEKAQISRKERNKLRQNIYYLKKYGLDNYISHEKIEKNNFLFHIYGKISYVSYINSDDKEFKEYKIYLKGLIEKHFH
ncbi:reverse transcriptase [Elizabethkingia anophelis]|uniref:retron St85 family RNA-directed DNA polymerase n=1 Tax=Elizabethkingia anophelis TaxID=1117645 RepID=UPI0021A63700|nr:RNA-directed DNA polymerase [Elizabethkingia anophelis]MCT4057276.1 RNA-directed DNA polymerase [Elizabethkingia anophelis]MCT4067837.1 RNA-directed DNA polymerase [Elizabethkingia anophelis]MCT4119108.1 RNA-directed DNA polymerase [Elizabethkingia anophelis]MCT4219026.1 RNA-directed DNA polymerase [Elizabethkingia anophelis]